MVCFLVLSHQQPIGQPWVEWWVITLPVLHPLSMVQQEIMYLKSKHFYLMVRRLPSKKQIRLLFLAKQN